MGALVLGLHAVGFTILIAVVAPHHYALGASGAFTVGLGLTAYTLGLRHAFDADHIAAIDNTTRKLMAERQRPLSVGFWFSLGHSSVVFGLAVLFALGIRALSGPVRNGSSALHHVTSLIGTGVSGGFLYVIAALNLVVLMGILRVVREMRQGRFDEAELERRLDSRGLLNRVYGRFTRMVTRPWHMYPLGLLFGLGFDSSFMNFAYGWAFSEPVRKVFYNLTITGLSVTVALFVGTAELLSLAAGELGLRGGFWAAVSQLDINTLGYVIVGLFVATWAIALLVWRVGRIGERWSADLG
jgi:high-affinity nickel-transport protein